MLLNESKIFKDFNLSKIEKFLIVEEDDSIALFFQVLLKELGFENIKVCGSPVEALEMISKDGIQFLIVAWELKELPGTVFVQQVKAVRTKRHMPFLIYSKKMKEEDITLTKELGIANILGMPFDRDKAAELLKNIIEAESNITPMKKKIRQMEDLIAENHPGEALKLVDHTLTKKSPDRPHVKTLIGEVWLLFNKYDKAEASLKEALKDDDNYYPAQNMLAKVYSRMGKHVEAIAILEKLSKNSPKNLQTLLSLGNSYTEDGQLDKAKSTFMQVKALDETNSEANAELGKVAFKEGDMNLAAKFFAETSHGEEIARYFNNIAISHVTAGNYEKGIDTYKNAVKLLSNKAKMHLLEYNLALAYFKKGDLASSFNTLVSCYVSHPEYEKAYVTLARVSMEMKKKNIAPNKIELARVKKIRTDFKAKLAESDASKAKAG